MKILIIEDGDYKREQLTFFLKNRNIEYEVCEYVRPALRYICENKENLNGIILGLTLQSSKKIFDRKNFRGLDIIEELNRRKFDIPILVNSSRSVDMLSAYPFVYGHRTEFHDYDTLEDFVSFLRERDKQ